ncbi:MAG TPA: methionine--tRNA ligase [Pyrinomonadaceae bacterium]|nr:methionine--tRNA ligase [Pyrinomonadaceae bacterium]
MKTFYITTPIYYANSRPHLGHLYTTVVADALVRFKRQRGVETYFLTGTDEHGVNIERAAARNKRTPREQVDFVVGELKEMFAAYGLDGAHGGYDVFMRTSEPFHYEGAAHFWRRVAATKTPKGRDAIYTDFYEGWFCAACATFKTEEEIIEPKEEGGPPRCPVHETPLDRVSEESYFFRLSDYDEALLALYDARPDFVRPEARRNEVISFVRAGLQDVSISRLKSSVSWAIPVPDAPDHSIYVWFDALINYITALGYGSDVRRKEVGEELLEKFWPGTHLIGKDILRQHAILWPAMLMAAGVETPRAVVAHGMWLDSQGRKLSKTLGNAIDIELARRQTSADMVRYVLLREMNFGQDGRLGYETVIDRANSDLASGLGNLASRTLTMIRKYFDGVVPSPDISESHRLAAKRAGLDSDPMEAASSLELTLTQFIQQFEEFSFNRALETLWATIARTDKFLSDAKPWELARSEEQRETLGAVLYRAAETLRWLVVMLYPVMPESAEKLWSQLGQTEALSKIDPASLAWGGLKEGTRIGEVAPVFPRVDKAKAMAEIEKELAAAREREAAEEAQGSGAHATQAATPGSEAAADTKPQPPERGATEADAVPAASRQAAAGGAEGVANQIVIEEFAKVEMRVGQVLTAERVPKADKLLRLTVDVGEAEPRQILAGIAQHYEPDALVGRKIAVVTNLKPRKLRGFESQGMVLAASVGDEGRPVLATFTEDVPNGARLK